VRTNPPSPDPVVTRLRGVRNHPGHRGRREPGGWEQLPHQPRRLPQAQLSSERQQRGCLMASAGNVGDDLTGSLRAHDQVAADLRQIQSSAARAEGRAPPKVRPWRRSRPVPPRPRSRRTGGDRCSDSEAEYQRHDEDEHRHPDEKGALSCFGCERVQLVSFTFHFSFTFHCITDTPKGDVGI
jgi:hypothetical protein